MRKLRLSIAKKLIISLGMIAIVFFGVLITVHLIKLYQTNLRESELLAQQESLRYVHSIARTTDQTVTSLEMLELTLQHMYERTEAEQMHIEELMKRVLQKNTQLHSLYAIWEPQTLEGQEQAETERIFPYTTRSNGRVEVIHRKTLNDSIRPYYEEAKRSRELSLLEPYSDQRDNRDVMMISVLLPIIDEEGRLLGVLGADAPIEQIQQSAQRIRPLGGYVNIITAGGNYLANGREPKLVLQPYHAENYGRQEAVEDNKPLIEYITDSAEGGVVLRMLYQVAIKDSGWYIETIVPKKNMLSQYYKSFTQSLLIMTAALIIITFMIVILVRKLVLVQINKVIEVTSAVACGKTEQRLDIQSNDEFEAMAKHFNHMIDQNNEAAKLIEYQSSHDLLTGLPNRYAYYRHMEQLLSETAADEYHSVLLYIDLDRFKIINDVQDYAVGDQLLKEVASRIVHNVDDKGKVFHFGGDEFVVFLENTSHLHHALFVADEILSAIAETFQMRDRIFSITASIGLSIQHTLTKGTGELLLKEADIAMHEAKKERNTCKIYSASMKDVSKRELALERSMFDALEQGQFTLYYQPKVESETGKIYGAEALLRWKHPEFGMVSPLEFIPLAEKTGFIVPLGEWVLYTACQQLSEWERMGLPRLTVSVNMSMLQFQQKQIVHTIEHILSNAGIRPEQIELEITESIFMDNPDQTLRKLHELKQLGIKLSLDDFGTGYSSLSYLQNIPIHTLKLDKSFIKDIVSDYRKQMIFGSVIVIAHQLNLKVVTEGVETEDELSIVREHHCDAIQGYLYSPPVPAPKFAQLYMENQQFN